MIEIDKVISGIIGGAAVLIGAATTFIKTISDIKVSVEKTNLLNEKIEQKIKTFDEKINHFESKLQQIENSVILEIRKKELKGEIFERLSSFTSLIDDVALNEFLIYKTNKLIAVTEDIMSNKESYKNDPNYLLNFISSAANDVKREGESIIEYFNKNNENSRTKLTKNFISAFYKNHEKSTIRFINRIKEILSDNTNSKDLRLKDETITFLNDYLRSAIFVYRHEELWK